MAYGALLAALGLALLALARAGGPTLCTKVFTISELFAADQLVVASGVDPEDVETWVGTTVGYRDPLVWGGSGTSNIPVGELYGTCFIYSSTSSFCTNTVSFGDLGSISFAGTVADQEGASGYMAVTGGTGVYAGATGTARMTTIKVGGPWKYKFTLKSAPKC